MMKMCKVCKQYKHKNLFYLSTGRTCRKCIIELRLKKKEKESKHLIISDHSFRYDLCKFVYIKLLNKYFTGIDIVKLFAYYSEIKQLDTQRHRTFQYMWNVIYNFYKENGEEYRKRSKELGKE